MGFEAYDKAEEKYQAEVERLTSIAVKISFDDRSLFLKCLADAWLHAFPSDKRILKPAWEAIVTKYSLEAEAEQAQLEAEGIEAARAEYEEREEELAQEPEEGIN